MKVENVVNPPQKPVVRIKRVEGDSQLMLTGSPERKPRNRQPRIFTAKVPNGNWTNVHD